MTTHEAAEKIAAALNASGEYTAKVQIKGSLCWVHVADAKQSFGYTRVFDDTGRPCGWIDGRGDWVLVPRVIGVPVCLDGRGDWVAG